MLAYAVLVGVLFLAFAMAIVCVVSMWKIFVKAGARGWAAFDPILQFLCDDKNHMGKGMAVSVTAASNRKSYFWNFYIHQAC